MLDTKSLNSIQGRKISGNRDKFEIGSHKSHPDKYVYLVKTKRMISWSAAAEQDVLKVVCGNQIVFHIY
jgi:hypothetical protein